MWECRSYLGKTCILEDVSKGLEFPTFKNSLNVKGGQQTQGQSIWYSCILSTPHLIISDPNILHHSHFNRICTLVGRSSWVGGCETWVCNVGNSHHRRMSCTLSGFLSDCMPACLRICTSACEYGASATFGDSHHHRHISCNGFLSDSMPACMHVCASLWKCENGALA